MTCETSDLKDALHVGNKIRFESTMKDCDGIVIDISSASTLAILFRRPSDGAILTRTATLVNTGTDGKLEYTTIVTDLSVEGLWKRRAEVDGDEGSTSEFHVYPQWGS